jgi:hypothetical protein
MLKKLIFAAVAAILLYFVALVAVRYFVPTPPKAQSVQFSNGVTLTFLGVTYGGTNSLLVGKGWQKNLYNLLPAKLKSWSHAQLITTGLGGWPTNCPAFWFDERSPQQLSGPQASHQWTVIDEFGCEYSQYMSSGSSSAWISDHESVKADQMEPNSPHGRLVAMAVYETGDSTNRLATFIAPGLTLPPSLPANSPPLARAQAGDIQAELFDFITGLNCTAYPINYRQTSNGTAISQAIFRINRGGQPLPQWNPASGIRLTSQSGLVLHPRYWTWGRRDGNLVLNFEGTLDPAQGPWKLRIELSHESDFSPDELVGIPGVSLPAAGQTNQIGLLTNLLGETILIERAFGASNPPPYSLSSYFGQQPFLEVSVSPALIPGLHIRLCKALDEAGTNRSYGFYPGTDKGKYYFSLEADPNPHLLNLTFALHASRFVEFETNPRLAGGKGQIK